MSERIVSTSRPIPSRLRHLRRVERLDRALRLVVAAPFALLAPMSMTVDHFGDTPSSVLLEIPLALAVVAVISLGIFVFVLQEWSMWAYAYRTSAERLRPIDWGSGWDHVRRVLEGAGLDLDRVLAYTAFSAYSNLETRHRPRRSMGVLGVMSDWGARHTRKLMIAGGAAGVVLAVAGDRWPGWYDRPVFWVCLGVALVVMLPFAWRNGRMQYRLNARRPENIVVFPSQWRTLLRREDPGIMVLFLHEVSHVRHNDAGRRRITAAYARFAGLFAFIDAGMVVAVRAPTGVTFAAFVIVAGCGILGVRGAARALPLLEELRADAEACRDDAACTALREALARWPPTRQVEVRMRVLDDGWASRDLPVRAAVTAVLGFVLPILGVFALLWTGVLAAAPDL